MSGSKITRKSTGNMLARAIEPLEARTLLSATLTSPLSSLTVAQDSSPTTIDLNTHFDDPAVTGTTIAITTPLGSIPIELSDSATPQTVQNFLQNITIGTYNDTLFYRAVKNFVIQAGDQVKSDGTHVDLSQFPTVPSEAGQSNVRGTIAMALGSGPNSGATEYFINLTDNSSLLDGSNDGGPFTVFGHVIYNGMSVADAISNAPTVGANTLDPQLPSDFPLPLQTAGGGTSADNLVTTIVSQSPHIVMQQPTSDNPSLVTASLGANNQLVLTYGAGQSGFAHITVAATDLGGNSVSQTFRVHVTGTSPGTVAVGLGGSKSAAWTQPDGTVVTATLSGPGTATLSFPSAVTTTPLGKGVSVDGQNLDPDIAITGGTGASKLTLTAKGGAKVGRIGNLTADADLGTINAKGVNLDGDLTATGSIKTLTLNGASNGTITVGTGPLAMVMKTTTALADELINSSSTIKSITAPGWNGTNNATSGITAPVVGSISVKTALLNSTFNLFGGGAVDLAKLSVGGDMQGVFINAVGSLGAISAGTMVSDTIFAGVTSLPAGQPLPNFPTDFASAQSIKSIKVKNSAAPTFSNTSIAAEVMGSMSLGRIATSNGGKTFGVAATSISSLRGTDAVSGRKFSLHKVTLANVSALEAKLGFSLNDFAIKMF